MSNFRYQPSQQALATALRYDQVVGLDFETYGPDLPKVGLRNYVNDPTFFPLLAGATRDNSALDLAPDHWYNNADAVFQLFQLVDNQLIVAHNAGFEEAVLHWIAARHGFQPNWLGFIDSAVLASMLGLSRGLRNASLQLGIGEKLDEGTRLMRKFSMSKEPPTLKFIALNSLDWELYKVYVLRDAQLGKEIFDKARLFLNDDELVLELLYAMNTQEMNSVGWPVDIELTTRLREMREFNNTLVLNAFYEAIGDDSLNLNSPIQLQKWCRERGVVVKSFAEDALLKVQRALDKRDKAKGLSPEEQEVQLLIKTKQDLGGSSLKKLDPILRLSHNGRLYDQYEHVGAAQTFRTTGRGVQMQNLKRLPPTPYPVEDLMYNDHRTIEEVYNNFGETWPGNDVLGENVRQVFAASHPDGQLLVGDFASVESRGLAWYAGAKWKLSAFQAGRDMYKLMASSSELFDIPYDEVTREQRKIGKVGELSCGYQAGPPAVRDQAQRMGVDMSAQQAAELVSGWRATNVEIVEFWHQLQLLLENAYEHDHGEYHSEHYQLSAWGMSALPSIEALHPGARDITIRLYQKWHGMTSTEALLTRVFRGVYKKGRDLIYHRPSSNKTGPLWTDEFTDPKTKRKMKFKIYGGKLSGILTQSLCREIFMDRLQSLRMILHKYDNVKIVGQFHDEIVVEWWPASSSDYGITHDRLQRYMKETMSTVHIPDFPLDAEIESAKRYLK